MKIIISAFFSAVLFAACISVDFKSDYPEIEYYRLKQIEPSVTTSGSIDGILQIRDFAISSELETNYILALNDQTKIQRYYYHRWISDCSEMATDFFFARFNIYNSFKGGVIRGASTILPDYIMEGQVVDMMAYNGPDETQGANYITLTLRISVIKREPLSTEKNILHTKIYKTTAPRKNSSVITIPLAYSKAFSEIADQALNDVQNAIAAGGDTDGLIK